MSMVMMDTASAMSMTDTATPEVWTFGGVETLNGTQIPDAYFDEVMAPLGPSAFTVLMYVARRTFGFKRHSDQISLDQICHGIVTTEVRDADGTVIKPARRLDHGTGLAKSTVVRALDRLIAAGLIRKRHNIDPHRGQLANTYGIVFKDPAAAAPAAPSLPDTRTAPAQEAASLPSSPVRQRDTPCRVRTQAPVAEVDTQQTVETTNSRRQTETSKRTLRVTRVIPSLDSTDSITMTTDDTVMGTLVEQVTAPVGERIAALSAAFGDDAPQASRTRVLNMQRASGLGDTALLALLDEATAIARAQAPTITKRGRGGTIIRMPYLLATLRGLVEATTNATVTAGRTSGAPRLAPSAAPPVSTVDDPPATTEAEVVWRAVLGEVQRDVTAENYTAWFIPTRASALDGDVLRVTVPTPFHQQWLEHKLRGCVDRAIGRTGHGGVRVAYAVVAPGEGAARSDQVGGPAVALAPPPAAPAGVPPAASCPAAAAAWSPAPSTPAAPPPVVVCPCCRTAPCRCRLGDQVRRVIAARSAVTRVGAL